MKNVLKQLVKAICYMVLFVFNQVVVTFIFTFSFGIKQGMELQASGGNMDEGLLLEESTNFILNNNSSITLISGIITLVFLWVFFIIRKKRLSTETSMNKFDTSKTIYLIILGFSFALFVASAISILPIPESVLESYMQSSQGLVSGSFAITLIATVIVAPIVEEIVFRGLILSRLNKVINTVLALILSSSIFATLHGHILWIAYTFVLGILFGIVAIKMNSILPSIIFHMSFNLAGMFVDMIPFPEWAIGVVCLVSLVLSAILLKYILKNPGNDTQELAQYKETEFNIDI